MQTCSGVETDAEAMEHLMQRGGREPRPLHMGPLESKDFRSWLRLQCFHALVGV